MADYTNIPDPSDVFESASEEIYIRIDPFGELTTTDEIRAVFGLSEVELPDETLTQRVYARTAYNNMLLLVKNVVTLWSEDDTKRETLRPLVEDYVLYNIADQICDVLPILIARSITDSKATFQRFDTDLQAVIANIRQRFAVAAKALMDAVAEETTTTIWRPTLFGSGSPTYDPVTGDE